MEDKGPGASQRLGTVVRQLRVAAGLSMEQLAERAGFHRTYIGLIERGERQMTVAALEAVAQALGLSLSEAVVQLEPGAQPGWTPRTVDTAHLENEDVLANFSGLEPTWLTTAIEGCYATLDMIDYQLQSEGAQPLSSLVELANLSSIIGNVMCAELANHSAGMYTQNAPHTFPDLLPAGGVGQEGIELKVALETNTPKGHLPKPGKHLAIRYILATQDGSYERGRRGATPWIWEVRAGQLGPDDFSESNTPGDSGKTAVIQNDSLKNMTRVYYVPEFLPYARPWG